MRKNLYRDLLAVALLAVLCGLFFWRIITPNLADRAFFPSGDFSHQFYAFSVFQAQRLEGGNLPLWSPYHFSGHPFLADVQAAVFYPLRVVTILLGAPWGFPLYALELEAVFHFFLGSLFTYLFVRHLLGNRFAALVSAVVFAYGGYLTSYPTQQMAILEVDVWLPLILLVLDIAWEKWKRREGVLYFGLAGLILGLAILAGHPQSYMYILYLSLFYFVFRTRGERWSSRGLLFGLFLLVGLGLAAVQVLPSLEYMSLSPRLVGTYEVMAPGFPLHDLIHLVLPGALSVWSPLYLGILPLFLALLALYLGWRKEAIFWGVVALLALILSLGGSTFLYSIFYNLAPGFGLFRRQERAAYIFSFATAILAGYGTNLLFHPMARSIKKRFMNLERILGLCVIAALALATSFLFGWLEAGLSNPEPFGHLLNRSLLLLLFVLGSWVIVRLRLLGPKRKGLLCLALALVVFDLFTVNWQNSLQGTNPEDEYEYEWRQLLEPVLSDSGIFRVANEDALPGNYGFVYGVEDTGGGSPLKLKRYQDFIESLSPEMAWRLLNVKYVITWRRDLSVPTELVHREIEGSKIIYVHRLLDPQPRAYMVYGAEISGDDEEALATLSRDDFDPEKTAVLLEDPGLELLGRKGEWKAVITERDPEKMVLEVETSENGLLVLSEVYYPGWRAFVDGKETKIYRADYVLRALPLEAGQHRVEFVYDPISLKVGMAFSVLTLGVLTSAFLVRKLKTSRSRKA